MTYGERRSIRVPKYDYSAPGAYYVTVCTHDHRCLFGDVVDSVMRPNEYGEVVRQKWFRTGDVREGVILPPEEFVVMPNHMHGIVHIVVGATRRVAPTSPRAASGPTSGSIGAIIGQFKSQTAKRINALRQSPGAPVWQRNYYEHIVRDEISLEEIREYIATNPLKWQVDRENPNRVAGAG